jgi:hypothetical protein
MSTPIQRRPCPYCQEMIAVTAVRCRFCGEETYEDEEDDEEEEERSRRRDSGGGMEATDLLIPTNVSGWSMASCYMGLIGFFIPCAGLLFTIPGLIFGFIAIRKRRRGAHSYGAVTSDIRAIVGIIFCSLSILIHVGFGIFLAVMRLLGKD